MELSSRSSVRDSCFAFRLRRRRTAGSAVSGAAPPHQQQHHQQQQQQPPPAPFVYAHVFCRQRHDARLRRGCEQKSVVLLSHLPLPGLLEQLARLVGPVALSAREQCADVLHQVRAAEHGAPQLARCMLTSLPQLLFLTAAAAGCFAFRLCPCPSPTHPPTPQVYEEVLQWPPLEWGSRLDQHLLGLPLPLGLQLPMLTTLPASALPAAVAATLHRAERAEQPQAAEDAPAGAAAAQAAAAAQHGAVAGAPVAAATAAQVAAALADELDGSGLPLCLLPQAWGQQELEPSPWGDCDAWTPLRAALPQLWALWELLLLGEPLMVVSPSPGEPRSTAGRHRCRRRPCPCVCAGRRRGGLPRCERRRARAATPTHLFVACATLRCRRVLGRGGCAAQPAGPLPVLPGLPAILHHPRRRVCPPGRRRAAHAHQRAAAARRVRRLAGGAGRPPAVLCRCLPGPRAAGGATVASGPWLCPRAPDCPALSCAVLPRHSITNLYLIKALPGWPNVLSAGFTAASLAPSPSSDHLEAPEAGAASAANGSSHGGSHGGGLQPSESASSLASSAGGGGGRAPTAAGTWLGGTLRRTPTSPAALLSAPVDCCWLQYKPCCRPDRAVLDRLVTPQATGEQAGSTCVHRLGASWATNVRPAAGRAQGPQASNACAAASQNGLLLQTPPSAGGEPPP